MHLRKIGERERSGPGESRKLNSNFPYYRIRKRSRQFDFHLTALTFRREGKLPRFPGERFYLTKGETLCEARWSMGTKEGLRPPATGAPRTGPSLPDTVRPPPTSP